MSDVTEPALYGSMRSKNVKRVRSTVLGNAALNPQANPKIASSMRSFGDAIQNSFKFVRDANQTFIRALRR